MSSKTVLFCPLNSPGHINPSLSIANQLKHDHGYRTVFLLLGPTIGDSIQKNGHELITLDDVEPYEEDDGYISNGSGINNRSGKKQFLGAYKWPQLIKSNSHLLEMEPVEAFIESSKLQEKAMCGEMIANHENYARAIQSLGPDLIVSDAYYVPPCVMKSGVPWVKLYSANPLALYEPVLPGGVKPLPMLGLQLHHREQRLKMRADEPEQWNAMVEHWRNTSCRIHQSLEKIGGRLTDFMQQNGCQPPPPGKQAHDSPFANIYIYPIELDYDQDDDILRRPLNWTRCESMIRRQVGQRVSQDIQFWSKELDEAMQDKREMVYFSLGSIASGLEKFMQKYIDYLKDDHDRLYVISKGVNGDNFELNSSNMIGANYLPQTFFLERAKLAIIHGGNNSITECMYYGVPMIVLPMFSDQKDNAQRVEDVGLGCRLDLHHCSKQELRSAIDKLINDSGLANKLRTISKRMQSNDDLDKISSLLKTLMENKHLDEKETIAN